MHYIFYCIVVQKVLMPCNLYFQIEGTDSQYTVDGLLPTTEYEVFMMSYTGHGIYSNCSERLIFSTPAGK